MGDPHEHRASGIMASELASNMPPAGSPARSEASPPI